ncbi:hypothetical protein [Psychrobacter sp. FDAARGOS_221]|uniref:hypothetical protein n=1 Tax=Psychrobacter sp. FDAARGOS_221 TaxID=1975705 RepID=UPI000BB59197|nr:hypothetical protein [Psychrobacter sp. FDAARGOS_221]PNK59498.1 hypothetical protein A6J60_000420 [Psychrobacter sp. FDAARGOS_221]
MAIFAVGAYYDEDVSQEFIDNGIAGPGWGEDDAPELHQFIKSLKVGDIIYIKAAAFGAPITVKAIGIILDNVIVTDSTIVSIGRNVKWVVTDKFTIEKQIEKNNVRSNTMYEEFHPEVQKIIIDKLFN